MPTTVSRPRLRRSAVPAVLALSLVLLCICTAAGLTGSFFFPLFSLWADCFLFCLTLAAVRRAGVRFELFHGAVLIAVYLLLAICTTLQVNSRSFVYIWDYSNYTLLQYQAEAAFETGALAGLGHILSTLTEDYTSFICLFTEFPFCLTEHTGDDYVLCQLISVLPTLLVALGGLTIKIGQLLPVRNDKGFFLIGVSMASAFPLLRMAAALGQPDWFGLIFALIILLLTLDFRFDAGEPARCVGIFFATAALVLTRRWYLYFIVAYYAVYAVTVLVSTIRLIPAGQGRRAADRLRRFITFGAGSLAAILVLFWPVVQRILSYSYETHYAAYNVGGLALELASQSFRLGPMYLPLVVCGVVWAFVRGRGTVALQTLAVLAISLVLFTRVQNMGSHQSLLLMPGYFILMLLGVAALADTLNRLRYLKLGYWLFALAFSLSARLSPLTTIALPDFLFDVITADSVQEFIQLDTLIYDRSDIHQIEALARWIDRHCADGEFAYMIPHSMTYCPDTFKNVDLPEQPLEDKLSFGFGILGTHAFPTDIFDAKYVITADPFPWCYEVSDVAQKLNNQFLALKDTYFTYETQFDMGNGTVFTVYRRIVPATRAEADAYLSAFAAEDAQFPELYSQVINDWCRQKGL